MKLKCNRLIAGLLAFLLVLSAVPITVSAAGAETVADLEIGTLSELSDFVAAVNNGNDFEGKNVVLTADITLGGESNEWTAIGTTEHPFKGTFDGNNHIVSGLYIASGSQVGFFGVVNGGMVKNLVVKGSVTGSGDVSGVVGQLKAGQVLNCGNEAEVNGSLNVGRVVGSDNGDCLISSC